MNEEQKFEVDSWYATAPSFVLETLATQLKAAAAVWPVLDKYIITQQPDQSAGAKEA
jgi:hypothetical protein